MLIDGQSAHTLPYMPNMRKLQGTDTTFENFSVPTATCCPSRATFLRGQYTHSAGMHSGKGGNDPVFASRGLDAAGYRTGLFGKYSDGYEQYGYVPPGWDRCIASR